MFCKELACCFHRWQNATFIWIRKTQKLLPVKSIIAILLNQQAFTEFLVQTSEMSRHVVEHVSSIHAYLESPTRSCATGTPPFGFISVLQHNLKLLKKHKKIFRFFKFNLLKEDINCANRNSVRDCVQHNFRGFSEIFISVLVCLNYKEEKKDTARGKRPQFEERVQLFPRDSFEDSGSEENCCGYIDSCPPSVKRTVFLLRKKDVYSLWKISYREISVWKKVGSKRISFWSHFCTFIFNEIHFPDKIEEYSICMSIGLFNNSQRLSHAFIFGRKASV